MVEKYTTDMEDWTKFTADLPEGSKYFAIRHTSTDIFGVMLDDVTFNYAGSMSQYRIYCEGTLVATVDNGVTDYTVAADQLTEGEHTFAVTAVYANGQESKPATATIVVVTDIRQIVAAGRPVDVYTVDGKLVRSQAKSLDGLKGVYVIKGRTIMIK